MVQLTRRKAVNISTMAAAVAWAGSSTGAAKAAEAAKAPEAAKEVVQGAAGIGRHELTPSYPGIPLISYVTTHNGIAYLSGITADPRHLGDVKDQTRQVLARIDTLLASVGTSKSKLLTTQVWLTDMDLFGPHNDAWNEWVDPKNPPVRACLQSPRLWRPGMLVEIMGTAAI